MKAKLLKASEWNFEKKVDVETIKDCLKFYDSVIIRKLRDDRKDEGFEDCEIEITIYDYYVE